MFYCMQHGTDAYTTCSCMDTVVKNHEFIDDEKKYKYINIKYRHFTLEIWNHSVQRALHFSYFLLLFGK